VKVLSVGLSVRFVVSGLLMTSYPAIFYGIHTDHTDDVGGWGWRRYRI
jgi:hypothetical protein